MGIFHRAHLGKGRFPIMPLDKAVAESYSKFQNKPYKMKKGGIHL